MNDERRNHDVLIIGGGPAGLSAALLLGRCGREVMVVDAGRPRNEASPAMHGFLTRDGIAPREFLRIAREELSVYPSIFFTHDKVMEVKRNDDGFHATLESGGTASASLVILANGLVDKLPEIDGIRDFYGTSVHHCPYCDGWENRGKTIGILGADQAAVDLATELCLWSDAILLFSQEKEFTYPGLDDELARAGIRHIVSRIVQIVGKDGIMTGVRTADGAFVACDSLFFAPTQFQHSDLAESLGCQGADGEAGTACDDLGRTSTDRVFVAGNAGKGIQMAIIAAAEGLKAGVAANEWLMAHPERSENRRS